jgi:prepilin-type processing-associated H-X9-DG protein
LGTEPFSPGWMTYKRMSQIARPSPDQLWVLTEEHPDGITDCVFEVDCQSQGATARLISVPANFHHGAANITFADGHVELHRWLDARTRVANRYCGCIAHYEREGYYTDAPYNSDVDWLQLHTSSKVEP